MSRVKSCSFPDIPPEISGRLFRDNNEMVIIGVIGKSTDSECNKMVGFDMGNIAFGQSVDPHNGQIHFCYNESNPKILYVHFRTPFDETMMEQMLAERTATKATMDVDVAGEDVDGQGDQRSPDDMGSFHTHIRTKFAQMLLFAIQVCHVIVLVETNSVFDTSFLSIFKALKVIREKYVLKFLPKMLKSSGFSAAISKEGRLCSPRFIFYFEKMLHKYKTDDTVQKYEFEIEDGIYKMLRNELVITNNSINSLFSIPRNKRFVCVNTDSNMRADPLTESVNWLTQCIDHKEMNNTIADDQTDSDDEYRPYQGFAKPLSRYKHVEPIQAGGDPKNRLLQLVDEHVEEAVQNGFDDSIAKYKGKNHFVIPSSKSWFELFKLMHKIFIENADCEAFDSNDPDYKAYLEIFNRVIDIDDRYFMECCEYGLELAIERYKEMLPHFYSSNYHEQNIGQSMAVLSKYGRGVQLEACVQKLTTTCTDIWLNGRQQCEYASLRGNPCVMQKHDANVDHNSGEPIISTCNCGRTQGARADPYTVRQANHEFYKIMMGNCPNCPKLEAFAFPIFEPSSSDYRAADVEKPDTDGQKKNAEPTAEDDGYYHLSQPSQLANLDLSLSSALAPSLSQSQPTIHRKKTGIFDKLSSSDEEMSPPSQTRIHMQTNGNIVQRLPADHEESTTPSDNANDSDSMNEIVVCVGGEDDEDQSEKSMHRQASTTEYLSGMIHNMSPTGLLPQYPSWSLVCVGHSSIYSHNSGLPEHVQSGFLVGTNFLLPWDVQVRLENASSWSRAMDKARNRHRKPTTSQKEAIENQVFMLKIFIGCEYEGACGHRFFMSSPSAVVCGGLGIIKDAGSKVVFNDMPLYFACPCRSSKPFIAQLMRVHVVTPKAPVNIILEPKVRTGEKTSYIFVSGSPEPMMLSQSAYWILRLPYVYESRDGPIKPPSEVTMSNYMSFGCLMAGMFGVVETKSKST